MPSPRRSPTATVEVQGKHLCDAWWTVDASKLPTELFRTLDVLRSNNVDRRTQDKHHMRLYGNLDVAGGGWKTSVSGLFRGDDGRMRYNLCSSAVDTAASLIAQQRPKPMFLTTEGDYGLQRQARLRTRVLEGQLYDLQAYELMPEVFVDAAVLGTGCIYGYLDPMTGDICLERVLPLELQVDHADGIGRAPRSLFRRRPIAREVLMALYPKLADKIKTAAKPSEKDRDDFWLLRDTTIDQVVVVEAWHLPSTKDGKDGKHVLSVSNAVLFEEEWCEQSFPFAFFRWKKRQVGFWGCGIVEECRDAQLRINRLIKRVEELQHRGATAWVMCPRGANVRTEQMSNAPLTLVHYDGPQPPQIQAFNATPPELQQEIDRIREQTFSQLGLSQTQAEGKKPSGLDSGAAQRAHDDINSRRHIMNAKAYEDAYMDLVKLLEMLNGKAAKHAEENGEKYTAMARVQRGRSTLVREVKWDEVKLPENKYRVTMFPTSALPSTPAGKWAAVQEWIASGFISRPYAQQLLDFPDLDAAARMELADLDAAMHDVEQMLDEVAVLPDPHMNLEMTLDVCRKAYLQARCNDAPESVLELMRDYMAELAEMLTPPAPPVPPMQAMPPDMGAPPPMPEGPMPPSLDQGGMMMQ